jgi:hypothetical protein
VVEGVFMPMVGDKGVALSMVKRAHQNYSNKKKQHF